MTAPAATGPLRDFAAAAEFLGVSESWLRHEVAARRVPHTRLGRRVLFSDADLTHLVTANAVAPHPPVALLRRRPSAARRRDTA